MKLEETNARRTEAARQFDAHEQRQDGAHVVSSLDHGLSLLRDELYTRVRDDVEQNFGQDSMLMPVSPIDTEQRAKIEIELFQTAAAVCEVRHRSYVNDDRWFANWLMHLRLGELAEEQKAAARTAKYLSYDAEKRRLAFSTVLGRALPVANKAPLVLFQLFPYSVSIVVATAFRDSLAASEARNRQIAHLPSIAECHECHGLPLDNGERCHVCGNPLWSYTWLTESL